MTKKKFRCSDCEHTWEVAYGAPRPSYCPQCKSPTFIGQRRIEAMLVEEVEVGVREISVDLRQNRGFENES
jgi:Zn finger protein HypA/HybF involved in hydrogenase expression